MVHRNQQKGIQNIPIFISRNFSGFLFKQKVDLDPEDYVIWAREKWYQWTGIIGIPGCFLLGMVFMITYYRFYHPEGKMPSRKQTATLF